MIVKSLCRQPYLDYTLKGMIKSGFFQNLGLQLKHAIFWEADEHLSRRR